MCSRNFSFYCAYPVGEWHINLNQCYVIISEWIIRSGIVIYVCIFGISWLLQPRLCALNSARPENCFKILLPYVAGIVFLTMRNAPQPYKNLRISSTFGAFSTNFCLSLLDNFFADCLLCFCLLLPTTSHCPDIVQTLRIHLSCSDRWNIN